MSTGAVDSRATTAEEIAGNEDLLAEILSHLPARCLLRFKCVSKQWLLLISDDRFSVLHSTLHPRPPCSALFFFHHSSLSSPVPFPSCRFVPLRTPLSSPTANDYSAFLPFLSVLDSSGMKIIQSCNGLLLLCTPPLNFNDSALTFYICNPTLNQITKIDLPDEVIQRKRELLGLNLAFDPSRWIDFKIICVWKSELDEKHEGIDLYSRGSGGWTRSIGEFSAPFDVEFERPVYWNGRIHWLSHTEETVFFDVDKQSVQSLPLPPPLEGAYIERFRYFGESRGRFHLIEIRTNSVPEVDVLQLEEEGCEHTSTHYRWTVKYRVNLDILGQEFSDMFEDYTDRMGRKLRFYAFSVLSLVVCSEEDEEEDAVLVLSIPGNLICYSFKTGAARFLCEVDDQTDRWLPFKGYNAFQFIESLYSI